ncbi:helicase associated domain-containing protein [Streptomyces sp. NPDC002990]
MTWLDTASQNHSNLSAEALPSRRGPTDATYPPRSAQYDKDYPPWLARAAPVHHRGPANSRNLPAEWPPAGFPLGVWIADCRRHYRTGALDGDRIVQLEKLGMLWSLFDARFDEGHAAVGAWAAASGVGLAAPIDADIAGYPVGRWLNNQRAAARRTKTPLSPERRTALAEIDPDWCPEWPSTGSAPSVSLSAT